MKRLTRAMLEAEEARANTEHDEAVSTLRGDAQVWFGYRQALRDLLENTEIPS